MSFEKYRQEMLTAAKELGQSNADAFLAPAYQQMGASQAMDIEAFNRQHLQGKRDRLARAEASGINLIGPETAADQKFAQQIARRRQQTAQERQGLANLGVQMGERARQAGLQLQSRAALAGMQEASRVADQQFRREIEAARLNYQRTRDKQQYNLAVKNADRNYRATVWDAKMKEISLSSRLAESREGISASRQKRGALYGGGGGMTSSFSTGANTFAGHLKSMGVMG